MHCINRLNSQLTVSSKPSKADTGLIILIYAPIHFYRFIQQGKGNQMKACSQCRRSIRFPLMIQELSCPEQSVQASNSNETVGPTMSLKMADTIELSFANCNLLHTRLITQSIACVVKKQQRASIYAQAYAIRQHQHVWPRAE